MKLDNRIPDPPSVRSMLEFDKAEVIEALKLYAVQQGYCIAAAAKFTIWQPRRDGNDDSPTTLVTDVPGDIPTIVKEVN